MYRPFLDMHGGGRVLFTDLKAMRLGRLLGDGGITNRSITFYIPFVSRDYKFVGQ